MVVSSESYKERAIKQMAEKFDHKRHIINLKGKEYLPAAARIAWFRSEHPDWGIVTDPVIPLTDSLPNKYAIFKASIYNAEGKLIATGTKTESIKGFQDYVEKAETGAVSRALSLCGYGTLQSQEFDEGTERGEVTDSPQPVRVRTPSERAMGDRTLSRDYPAKAPQRPVQAPAPPRGTPTPSSQFSRPSGQRPVPKLADNDEWVDPASLDEDEENIKGLSGDAALEEEGEDESESEDEAEAEKRAIDASINFRGFVLSLGGMDIQTDEQEKNFVNRLLRRSGPAANVRPTSEEYMTALKAYKALLAKKAQA